MTTPDTQTLHANCWRRFVAIDGTAIYLSDQKLTTKKHQAHMGDRYQFEVFRFESDEACVYPYPEGGCDEQGGALMRWTTAGLGVEATLYEGDDLAAATAAFDDAERELRAMAHG